MIRIVSDRERLRRKARALRDEGMTWAFIAARLRVSINVARRLVDPEGWNRYQRNYRKNNRPKVRAQARIRRERNQARENERCREWYYANRKKANAATQRWRAANADHVRAVHAQWERDHRVERLEYQRELRKRRVPDAAWNQIKQAAERRRGV